jgi:uncharacterized metal-binding protein YceD (DUF177 family)
VTQPPEFHRPLTLDRMGATGFSQRIEATEAERAALAQRLGVPALGLLVCDFRLQREGQRVIAAGATIQARVTQVCVVSLDEFESDLRVEFRVRFVPAALESEEIDPEVEDEIPYDGGKIDLGEAVVQELALALDPYPRKPDAELPPEAAEPPASPFTVLRSRGRVN